MMLINHDDDDEVSVFLRRKYVSSHDAPWSAISRTEMSAVGV